MVKQVRRRGGLTHTALVAKVREWSTLDRDNKQISARVRELRDTLMGWVESQGQQDADGHLWLKLPEEIDGIVELKRERAVSVSIDYEAALEIVKKKLSKARKDVDREILGSCITTVEVLDERAFYAAAQRGLISNDDLDAITTRTEQFRFKPQRRKGWKPS